MARELTTYNTVVCWVDVAQVANLTNTEVDGSTMAQAQGIINVESGVDPELLPIDLRANDRRRLEDALTYQAAWMAGRVSPFEETQAQGVSQDGVSAQYVTRKDIYLAPLAQLCLNQLSWASGAMKVKRAPRRFRSADDAQQAVLRGLAEDNSGFGGTARDFS